MQRMVNTQVHKNKLAETHTNTHNQINDLRTVFIKYLETNTQKIQKSIYKEMKKMLSDVWRNIMLNTKKVLADITGLKS